jgi:hypothetical protein
MLSIRFHTLTRALPSQLRRACSNYQHLPQRGNQVVTASGRVEFRMSTNSGPSKRKVRWARVRHGVVGPAAKQASEAYSFGLRPPLPPGHRGNALRQPGACRVQGTDHRVPHTLARSQTSWELAAGADSPRLPQGILITRHMITRRQHRATGSRAALAAPPRRPPPQQDRRRTCTPLLPVAAPSPNLPPIQSRCRAGLR